MVVDPILPLAERGPNDHRKDAPPFTFVQFWKTPQNGLRNIFVIFSRKWQFRLRNENLEISPNSAWRYENHSEGPFKIVPTCEFPYTYVVRSIEEHEYSDLVSIRFLVESDTLDFSTLNLTLDDFLFRLSVRLRLNFSVWLDFLIRLPSRLGTGGFGFFIHFSRSITTFCFFTWSLLLVILLSLHFFYNFLNLFVYCLIQDLSFGARKVVTVINLKVRT